MELISLQPKNYRDYLPFIDEDTEDDLEFLSGDEGKRVAMVSATAYGGEWRKTSFAYPLINSMGVEMDWWVIKGSWNFLRLQKKCITVSKVSRDS